LPSFSRGHSSGTSTIEQVIKHPGGNERTRAIMSRLAEPIADHVEHCLKRV
jgi:hypothetical protein